MQAFCQPLIFVFLFERRIDQNEAALLLRRQVSAERQPAIKFRYPCLIIAFEQTRERTVIIRVQLHRGKAVLRAKQHARKLGRTGIILKPALWVQFSDGSEIRLQQFGDFGGEVRFQQLADAGLPLAGFLGLFGG